MRDVIKRWFIIDIIFAGVFFLIFFAISGVSLPVAVWINLAFVLFSHAFLLIARIILPESRHQYTNLTSMIAVCLVYIIVTSILAVILSLIVPNSVNIVVVIHSVILLLFLVVFISNINALKRNVSMEANQSGEQYAFVNQMIYMTLQAQAHFEDNKLKTKCDYLLNVMRSSQYKSEDRVSAIEQIIIGLLTDLATGKKSPEEQEKQLDEILSQLQLRNNILSAPR